jgi:hypothetical protein
MKKKLILFLFASFNLLLFVACTKDSKEEKSATKSFLDTLKVPHEMKGYEIYSWPEGKDWYFSILVGTNRIKTYEEVTSNNTSVLHLITVTGIDTLKLVLEKFPENEYITLIGEGWLKRCWGGNYENLQLPPQNYIDDITRICTQKKLNLQITD